MSRPWFTPGLDVEGAVGNPFVSESVADRYRRGRPYYHAAALRLGLRRLGIEHVRSAVDIGCGTGLSTRAVRDFADRVVGLDPSPAMLRAAQRRSGVYYVAAVAERVPLPDASAELATVGAELRWCDQPRVFTELTRVLGRGGGLVVYSDFFHGELVGRPAFTGWLANTYLPRYPTPPRHAYYDTAAAKAGGFREASYAEDEIHIPLSPSQLADYLLSQSNAAIAIQSGKITAARLRSELIDELSSFFPSDGKAEVVFGIRVWTTTAAA